MTTETIQSNPRIIYFPDNKAHCNRSDCPQADDCLRHQALLQKRQADEKRGENRMVVMVYPEFENCPLFWEIE